jgi:hypothetical protein
MHELAEDVVRWGRSEKICSGPAKHSELETSYKSKNEKKTRGKKNENKVK